MNPWLSLLAADPDPAGREFGVFDEPGATFWLPPQASEFASSTDNVFYFIYWISVFFFVLICVLMLWFAIRYRRRYEGRPATSTVKHNTALELTWTIIPLILVVVMFYAGFRGYMNKTYAPDNAIEIYATGYKWYWLFQYPNGHVDRELHLEVDRPFRIILTSNDVTHSLYIPVFRVKKDAVPGRYNKMWFTPSKTGEFRVFCTEYCGTGHSDMVARCIIHPRGEWQNWLNEAADPFKTRSFAEVGALIYSGKGGCNGCHSIDGSANVGPSFAMEKDGQLTSIFGKTENFQDGSTAVVDENYIRESILYPNERIVQGYQGVMNSYQGLLSDREITALVEFIKSLDPEYQSPAELDQPEAGEADETDGPDEADTDAATDTQQAHRPLTTQTLGQETGG